MTTAQAKRILELAQDYANAEGALAFDEGRSDMNEDTRMGIAFDRDINRHTKKVATRLNKLTTFVQSLITKSR